MSTTSKRPRSGAGSPTRRSANQVSTPWPAQEAELALIDVDDGQLQRLHAEHLERQRRRVVIAEQQDAAALELVALVQIAHPLEHRLGGRGDVVEVGQRLGDARQQRPHPLHRRGVDRDRGPRRPASRPRPAMRSTSRRVTPVRATISAGSPPASAAHRTDAAPVDGRRVGELQLAQRRTVIVFLTSRSVLPF